MVSLRCRLQEEKALLRDELRESCFFGEDAVDENSEFPHVHVNWNDDFVSHSELVLAAEISEEAAVDQFEDGPSEADYVFMPFYPGNVQGVIATDSEIKIIMFDAFDFDNKKLEAFERPLVVQVGEHSFFRDHFEHSFVVLDFVQLIIFYIVAMREIQLDLFAELVLKVVFIVWRLQKARGKHKGVADVRVSAVVDFL